MFRARVEKLSTGFARGQKCHCIDFGSQPIFWREKCYILIASEASYVYILSGQKFIKNAKNCLHSVL